MAIWCLVVTGEVTPRYILGTAGYLPVPRLRSSGSEQDARMEWADLGIRGRLRLVGRHSVMSMDRGWLIERMNQYFLSWQLSPGHQLCMGHARWASKSK